MEIMSHSQTHYRSIGTNVTLQRLLTAAAGLLALCLAAGSAAAPISQPAEAGAASGSGPVAQSAVAVTDTSSVISSGTGAPLGTLGGELVADGTDTQGEVEVSLNKSVVLTTRQPYKRVSIGSSEIADVNPVGPTTVLITGKKSGTTQLILWDDGDHSQTIEVVVGIDLHVLQDRLANLFPDSGIKAVDAGGAVALTGRVSSLTVAEEAAALAAPYGSKVLNLLEVSGGQQVMLQVRFAEVDRSVSTALGMNVGFSDGVASGASNIGQVNPFAIVSGTNGLAGSTPGAVTPAISIFGSGVAGRTAIDVFVSALEQNNLLRILDEPNLTAMSGQEASFLAGGSFPIPVVQGSGGGTTVTIQYEDYGVRLKFTPVVLGNGRIRLKVSPEVSDLDYTHAVTLSGFSVPALTTRNASTTVELADGQTFSLAGLLQNKQTISRNITPLLGDVPVLGALFRSVSFQRDETELMVLVTPRVVGALNPGHVPTLPGEHWRDPTLGNQYLNNDMGGPIDDKACPTTRPASNGAQGSADATPTTPAPLYHGEAGMASDADSADDDQADQTDAEPVTPAAQTSGSAAKR
jgi:pilus assembly protein CpaC